MNNMRNKILSLLVLLLTAATGARAQSHHSISDLRAEIADGGDKILQYDYYKYDFGDPIVISASGVIDGNGAIIDMEGANIRHVFYISADNVTIKNLSIINYTGTDDAIYFSGSGGSVYNIGYDVALNRVTTANTWTLSMPASDVLLTPQYATVAKWAVESAGTTEEKTLLPAAAEGVIAGTTVPLIVEGTVATTTIGETTKAQGTVKYAVTETKTTAPALTAFSATVPTAADYDDAKTVYVWYYIEGIEPENFADRTAQNTFDNSDICTEPIEVSVLTNKFTLTLDPKDKTSLITVTTKTGTGDATTATPDADGKIANIKMGSEVKLKANTGYKLRNIEVKKDANNIVDVATNAAQAGATFTEATFTMPAYDATATYELVRDITQEVDVEVRIDGTASERIRIAKDNDGHYKFVTTQSWQFAAIDKLDNNKDLTNGELNYTLKMKVSDEYEAKNFDTDLCPGTWRLEAEANADKPYDGIANGPDIILYDFRQITFSKGYSTHYYGESLVLDEVQEGLKFYAVTAVTDEKVTLTEIEAKAIPAGTPFIAYNSTAEPITAIMGILEADAVYSVEQFKGTAEDKPMAAQSGCYVLRNGDSTPTFRLVEGAGTLPAHRCWIELGAAGSRSLSISFDDDTTGIDSIDNGQLTIDNYYDLQGRKHQNTPQRKGVYVKDGRKVIVK
jgi:hypothetical protein